MFHMACGRVWNSRCFRAQQWWSSEFHLQTKWVPLVSRSDRPGLQQDLPSGIRSHASMVRMAYAGNASKGILLWMLLHFSFTQRSTRDILKVFNPDTDWIRLVGLNNRVSGVFHSEERRCNILCWNKSELSKFCGKCGSDLMRFKSEVLWILCCIGNRVTQNCQEDAPTGTWKNLL